MGFADFLARKPWVVLVLSLVPSLICLTVLVAEQSSNPITVDLGWASFRVDGSVISERVRAALDASTTSYEKLRQTPPGQTTPESASARSHALLYLGVPKTSEGWGYAHHARALTQTTEPPRRVYRAGGLYLLYVAENNTNILLPSNLQRIRELEQAIVAHPIYKEYCRTFPSGSDIGECSPPNSIMDFLYPLSLGDGEYVYNGKGSTMVDVAAMMKALLNTGRTGFTDRFIHAGDANPTSSVLLSRVRTTIKHAHMHAHTHAREHIHT
jgi:hypothetical protein